MSHFPFSLSNGCKFRAARFLSLLSLTAATSLAAQTSEGADPAGLARDFYNGYLDSLPDPRREQRILLEANLLKSLKRILPREDPFEGGQIASSLQASELTFARVHRTDPFVRGILKEAPHLKIEEFMYIVKFRSYMAFLCYRADPVKYRVDETPNYLLIKKKPAMDGEKEKPAEDHPENKIQ
jgi:hypothetical protein